MAKLLLEIKHVKKEYHTKDKTIIALKDVSLDIFQGEIFGLLGVNGAGKTTLSSIIATLCPPTSGDVLFNGVSIYQNVAEYRLQLGLCPQKPNFSPMLSIEENLFFAGRYYQMSDAQIKERMTALMQQFELTQYKTQKVSMLSGGYKQRLLIARALMHHPKLIIFDEPTVALDPHVRRELWEAIKNLKNLGITVILTTHYLDEAEFLADRVCVLDKGSIMLIDTPENLKADFQKNNLESVFLELIKNKDS